MQWADMIYGYENVKDYKYIVAHTLHHKQYKYNALDCYDNRIKAIIKAIYNHYNDGLEWVVIENF